MDRIVAVNSSGTSEWELLSNEASASAEPAGYVPTVFISCVTSEFADCKPKLIALCDGYDGVKAVHQANITYPPDTLLEGLRQAIEKCDFVIHLIGARDGWKPIGNQKELVDWKSETLEAIRSVRERISDLAARLETKPEFDESLSYTQWEYWLAKCYRKPVFVFAKKETDLSDVSKVDESQREHIGLIERAGDYREPFSDAQELYFEVKRRCGDALNRASIQSKKGRLARVFDPLVDRGSANEQQRTPVSATRKRLKNRDPNFKFYGRKWLYDMVVDWLSGDQWIYWLEADAGFGKSSFVSKLALGWEADGDRATTANDMVAAIVFCDPSTGPFHVLREVCQQLWNTSPVYAKRFIAGWNQLRWSELTLPDDLEKTTGLMNQDVADQLVEQLIDFLLLIPLSENDETAQGKKRLIIIDGLDEVLQRQDGKAFNPLEQILKRLFAAALPDFRILVTSRPERICPQLSTLLGNRNVNRPKMSPMPEPDGGNRQTHEAIARHMRADAIELLKGEKLGRSWNARPVVGKLLKKSECSMLYLSMIVARIKKIPIAAKDVDNLPNGLAGYYQEKLSQYFCNESSGIEKFDRLIRPCLEVIAATEQAQITVDELARCFNDREFIETVTHYVEPRFNMERRLVEGKSVDEPRPITVDGDDVIRELRASLRGLVIETEMPLVHEQDKRVEGRGSTIFVPFHLSFMDWLIGRSASGNVTGAEIIPEHEFRIDPAEGSRRLAKWTWREYSALVSPKEIALRDTLPADEPLQHDDYLPIWNQIKPDPSAYWVQHGINSMLHTFEYLDSKRLQPFVPPAPGCLSHEKYAYLEHAVDLLGWLHCWRKVARIDKVVASALPALQSVLALTTANESELTSEVLDLLEPVDQITLFNLVKGICATDIIEEVIEWIGRTQLAPKTWDLLVQEMLELDEYVVRQAAGVGQAARYHRYMTDDSLDQRKRENVINEIDELLLSTAVDRREVGVSAIGEIAKKELRKGTRPPEKLLSWIEKLSSEDFDFYFCPTVLGDLLIELTLFGVQSPVNALVLESLDRWDRKGIFKSFWTPIWQYNRQDVIRVLGQRALHGKKLQREDIRPFEAEVLDEVQFLNSRSEAIKDLAKNHGGGTDKEGRDKDWGSDLITILNKPELDSPKDDDRIIEWVTRHGVEQGERIDSAVELLHLMFTHTAWRVGENAAALIPKLATDTDDEGLCNQILGSLLDSLERAPRPHFRVFLGTSEACFLSRHFAKSERHEADLSHPSLIESCCQKYYDHENCDVRGLLVENLCFAVSEHFSLAMADKKRGFVDLAYFLRRHTEEIDFWLLDTDIWVLEHVYQLFHAINKHLKIVDEWLEEWVVERCKALDDEQNRNCLLRQLKTPEGKSWFELDRGDYLRQLQIIRRKKPFDPFEPPRKRRQAFK